MKKLILIAILICSCFVLAEDYIIKNDINITAKAGYDYINNATRLNLTICTQNVEGNKCYEKKDVQDINGEQFWIRVIKELECNASLDEDFKRMMMSQIENETQCGGKSCKEEFTKCHAALENMIENNKKYSTINDSIMTCSLELSRTKDTLQQITVTYLNNQSYLSENPECLAATSNSKTKFIGWMALVALASGFGTWYYFIGKKKPRKSKISQIIGQKQNDQTKRILEDE